jgi:hypothetical protein
VLDHVGFEVLTAVVIKASIFWDIKPSSPLKDNRQFRRNISPPPSESKNKPSKKPTLLDTCFNVGFLLGFFFDCEGGGDMFLRNVG